MPAGPVLTLEHPACLARRMLDIRDATEDGEPRGGGLPLLRGRQPLGCETERCQVTVCTRNGVTSHRLGDWNSSTSQRHSQGEIARLQLTQYQAGS